MLQRARLEQLSISDEDDFAGIPLYARLKATLAAADATYLILPPGPLAAWDHALLLNRTFWTPQRAEDVLLDWTVPADVMAHRAWHELAHRALHAAAMTPAGLLLGEAIASAFDVYLIGKLLRLVPGADMLASQVPAMTEVLAQAGLSEEQTAEFFHGICSEPEASFEALRGLLYDVGMGLYACDDSEQAAAVLLAHAKHPLAPLLHHYELSNWVLYGRAYADRASSSAEALAVDAALREAPDSVAWLAAHWLPS